MRVTRNPQNLGQPTLDRPTERGATMVIVAIVVVVLFGMAAVLVIDLGNGWQSRRHLITATDAAALAAAQDYAIDLDGCTNQAATYVNNNFADATMVSCVLGGSPGAGWVTVTADVDVTTVLAGVIGAGDYDVSSASTARWGTTRTVGGLRPLSLCAKAFGIESWLDDPQEEAHRSGGLHEGRRPPRVRQRPERRRWQVGHDGLQRNRWRQQRQ